LSGAFHGDHVERFGSAHSGAMCREIVWEAFFVFVLYPCGDWLTQRFDGAPVAGMPGGGRFSGSLRRDTERIPWRGNRQGMFRISAIVIGNSSVGGLGGGAISLQNGTDVRPCDV